MPTLISKPSIVEAVGTKPKKIEEYAGRVNSGHQGVSVARMTSPEGWEEPGQKPEFDEYTYVLSGRLNVETEAETFTIESGQAVHVNKGEWVRYSTPFPAGAEYIAVCLPAFSLDLVYRDE